MAEAGTWKWKMVAKAKNCCLSVVLLLGGVGGCSSELGETASAPKEAAAVAVGSALYVAMPRPFVFNIPGSVGDRLVEIKVQLQVRGDNNEEAAKRHIPLIEMTLLMTFSRANADDLATTAGKEALKSKALQEVQAAMKDMTGKKTIEKVLFTDFVMQ